MLKPISKPKVTQLAFATQKVILNGEKMPNILDTSYITEIGAAITKKPKNPTKENKKQKNQNNNRGRNNFNQSSLCNKDSRNCSRFSQINYITNGQKRNSCTKCGGLSYNFSMCYLSIGQDYNLITDKVRKKFQNNMKAANFKKHVDDFRRMAESKTDQ